MTSSEMRAAALERMLRSLLDGRGTAVLRDPNLPWQLRTVEALSAELLRIAEFREVALAGWLQGPDGQLVETVVLRVLPWPQSAEVRLLVDAIVAAAQAQQRQEQLRAGVMTVAAALVIAVLATQYGVPRLMRGA